MRQSSERHKLLFKSRMQSITLHPHCVQHDIDLVLHLRRNVQKSLDVDCTLAHEVREADGVVLEGWSAWNKAVDEVGEYLSFKLEWESVPGCHVDAL